MKQKTAESFEEIIIKITDRSEDSDERQRDAYL